MGARGLGCAWGRDASVSAKCIIYRRKVLSSLPQNQIRTLSPHLLERPPGLPSIASDSWENLSGSQMHQLPRMGAQAPQAPAD